MIFVLIAVPKVETCFDVVAETKKGVSRWA
jgi:hypothetical protein